MSRINKIRKQLKDARTKILNLEDLTKYYRSEACSWSTFGVGGTKVHIQLPADRPPSQKVTELSAELVKELSNCKTFDELESEDGN